jgi:hypothetical protein
MRKRPISVAVAGWVFIAAGICGLVYHAKEFDIQHPLAADFLLVSFIRLLAILLGAFTLRGRNWARWGLVVWLGYHVGLSFFHPLDELIVHAVLFVAVLYVLYRPAASAYFRGVPPAANPSKPGDGS